MHGIDLKTALRIERLIGSLGIYYSKTGREDAASTCYVAAAIIREARAGKEEILKGRIDDTVALLHTCGLYDLDWTWDDYNDVGED